MLGAESCSACIHTCQYWEKLWKCPDPDCRTCPIPSFSWPTCSQVPFQTNHNDSRGKIELDFDGTCISRCKFKRNELQGLLLFPSLGNISFPRQSLVHCYFSFSLCLPWESKTPFSFLRSFPASRSLKLSPFLPFFFHHPRLCLLLPLNIINTNHLSLVA